MEPITRKELFIKAASEGQPAGEAAVTRVELYLDKIAGSAVEIPEPITRIEMYLAKIAGEDIETPEPITRFEMYLAKIAGMDVEPPEPITRVEMLLFDWSEGGDVSQLITVSGVSPLVLANALAKNMVSLVQDGKVAQASTPTPSAPVDIVCNNGKLAMVDDELPSGYKRITGITYDSSVYYQITDFFLKGSDTIRISFSVEKACNVFGCYTTTSATNNYSLYASTAANAKYLRYAGGTYKSQFATSTFGQRFDVVITPTGSSGMPSGQNDTWSEADFTATSALCIAHTSPSGTSSKLDGNIYGNIVVDGRLKLVPCIRMSDDAIGYYDTYTDTFFAPVAGTPVSLGYDPSHLSLKVVGTPEVITLGEQTASAVDLYSVGTYADTQDIISGVIKREVGIIVFDGTESWALSDSGTTHRYRGTKPSDSYTPASRAAIVSTHFVYASAGQTLGGAFIGASTYWYFIPTDQTVDTAEKWKDWLAAEYAAGNPVIVLYPLKESTTEAATPQHISLAKGNNVISVTAEVDGINLTAQYMAKGE